MKEHKPLNGFVLVEIREEDGAQCFKSQDWSVPVHLNTMWMMGIDKVQGAKLGDRGTMTYQSTGTMGRYFFTKEGEEFEVIDGIRVHRCKSDDPGTCYDETQTNDFIRSGDVVIFKDAVIILERAWPVVAFGTRYEGFHWLADSVTWDDVSDEANKDYSKSYEVALMVYERECRNPK